MLYAAVNGSGTNAVTTVVAEVFQASRVIDPTTGAPWLVAWAPVRPLRLLDLAGSWTTRAGGNQALCSGDRKTAQRWARAIFEQLPDLDGLTWPSSVIGTGRNVALFDRHPTAVPTNPDWHRPLADPGLRTALIRTATGLGYGLI